MKLSPQREAQIAKIQDLGSQAFNECTPEEYRGFIRLLRERIVACPWKTTKEIIREEATRGDRTAIEVAGVFELTPAEREARRMEHEIKMREIQDEIDFIDKIEPLMKEAIAALETGDQTTFDQAMLWHAARGNQFAKSYVKRMHDPESRRQSREVEAAFAWHPAWHKSGDHTWKCDTPDDPEVWETDKLLAQYRRHLANDGHKPVGAP